MFLVLFCSAGALEVFMNLSLKVGFILCDEEALLTSTQNQRSCRIVSNYMFLAINILERVKAAKKGSV